MSFPSILIIPQDKQTSDDVTGMVLISLIGNWDLFVLRFETVKGNLFKDNFTILILLCHPIHSEYELTYDQFATAEVTLSLRA